jgi:glycerol-3-phosphate O-acyltransferase
VTSKRSAPRVASLDEQQVFADRDFWQGLQKIAEQRQQDIGGVEAYARQCLNELAVHPEERYLAWVARLARFVSTRSYAPELDVNTPAVETLKELVKTRPLVFLWSHKSHLDSFVFMRALYEANFRPQPLSFAGINMNFAGFGALAKRSGAIFLRRSFKDDPVYKLVLQTYIDYLVRERLPLSWSIEGTRSRTGKLLPPKLGLIQWVLDAYRRASCDDALLVPVAISFDQIPEIDDYVAMQRGLPKRKESLRWFIHYIAGMRPQHGKIYVRFAEPVALSDGAPVSESLMSQKPERVQVQKLALVVCNRIEHAMPITATDLITLVLLAANGRGLDEQQISQHAGAILGLIQRRGLPTSGELRVGEAIGLRATLAALTDTNLLRCFDKGEQPVYVITPGRQLAAAYYRNTIVHYFLGSAVAEVALASAKTRSEATFWEAALELRDLLKFEFFFATKDRFRQDITAYLDSRSPDWRELLAQVFARTPPLFGHGILRSFIETYQVLAQVLLSRGDQEVAADHEETLVRACLERGEEMLLRRQIATETALSQPLINNAIKLAQHRGLLRGKEDLAAGRRAFAAEVQRAAAAVNMLQNHYDRGWAA